tara:strand:- start:504 stop:2159 length:1656 start_codon:yes stop_codon:yes gene_type:complete
MADHMNSPDSGSSDAVKSFLPNASDIRLYDTTLRDGLGMEGLSLSLQDKLLILKKLDDLGIHYIEGGYPGSNPKDADFFNRAKEISLASAVLVAFGSTRKPGNEVEKDEALRAVLDAGTAVITLVGKTSKSQVLEVLETTEEENLLMIAESIQYLKNKGKEVIFDAEHFFDGYKEDKDYAIACILTAQKAGASTVTLCDTNGGAIPSQIRQIITEIRDLIECDIGIHCHNDTDMAVASTLAAVEEGATQIQACLNGWGERTGNANMISVIPNLKLKLGLDVVGEEQLKRLTETALFASELANFTPNSQQPYVGAGAFAHKAGLHVAAVTKSPGSYTHIDPSLVGNKERILISELSGRRNIVEKLREQGIEVQLNDNQITQVLSDLKNQEARGYQFESAEASFELLVRRLQDDYTSPFNLEDFLIVEHGRNTSSDSYMAEMQAEAMVKMRIGDHLSQVAADGNGPVSALDAAVRKALSEVHAEIAQVRLVDYKVRIIDSGAGADAAVRVLIESSDGVRLWRTVGASTDVVGASLLALQDAYEYWLFHWGQSV